MLRAAAHRTTRRCGMKSGGGPPQSKTLARWPMTAECAKRLGVRQSSGALGTARGKRETVGKFERGLRVRVVRRKLLQLVLRTQARSGDSTPRESRHSIQRWPI